MSPVRDASLGTLRLLERTTVPRRMRTRFIGVGIRPEHVKTPDMSGVNTFGLHEVISKDPV